jgi:hypothetical protein
MEENDQLQRQGQKQILRVAQDDNFLGAQILRIAQDDNFLGLGFLRG